MSLAFAISAAVISLATTAPRLELLNGEPRVFGGQDVAVRVRVGGEGKFSLTWKSNILGAIIETGKRDVAADGVESVHLKVPEVRARVGMTATFALLDDEKVVAAEKLEMDVFPKRMLSGPAMSAEKPAVGLYDPEAAVRPALDEAGAKYELVRTDIQARGLESKIMIVAPNRTELPAEPMQGVRQMAEDGGVVIFLEEYERSSLSLGDLTAKFGGANSVSATRLARKEHIIFQNLLPDDLSNWQGAGIIALNSIEWPEAGDYRPWLASFGGGEARPLIVEYRVKNGRAIFCELPVGMFLTVEPAAQILLENLVEYARTVKPVTKAEVSRFALPPAAVAEGHFDLAKAVSEPKENDIEKAAVMIFVFGEKSGTVGLARLLEDGKTVLIQAEFDKNNLAAANEVLREAWAREREPAQITVSDLPKEELKGVEVDYSKSWTWGISAEMVRNALAESETLRSLNVSGGIAGYKELVKPGIVVAFEKGDKKLILCGLPIKADSKSDSARVMTQLASNLSFWSEEEAKEALVGRESF